MEELPTEVRFGIGATQTFKPESSFNSENRLASTSMEKKIPFLNGFALPSNAIPENSFLSFGTDFFK